MAAIILLLPAVAMRFTAEVDWTALDFLFAAVLLGGAGIALELAARRTGNFGYRAAVGVAVAASFLLLWANGAVGFIGNEKDNANLMIDLIPAVALIAAGIARFRAAGMARAMAAAALAQMLVPVIALTAGWHFSETIRPVEVAIPTAVFTALWLLSAALFMRAARTRTQS
jgi:hypothetical protein